MLIPPAEGNVINNIIIIINYHAAYLIMDALNVH